MNQSDIVVGLKEMQPTALRFAAQKAGDLHAHLRVIHSLDVHAAGGFEYTPHDSWQASGKRVLADARTFIDGLDTSQPAGFVLHSWSPYDALLDAAESAAMLVVGVDANAWFGPLFAGSVTERLITHSPIPVAVVPERAWQHEITGPVFVAIDNHGPATGPLQFAFTEADRTTRELHVAHVIPEETLFHRSESQTFEAAEALAERSEKFPDVTVKQRFFYDDPDDGCVRVSEEASLLVLGRRKKQIFGHPVLAEIAKRVHCPCIVVPEEDVH